MENSACSSNHPSSRVRCGDDVSFKSVFSWPFSDDTRFFPFSPRWLMSKGREQEALQVVSKIRSCPITDERVQLEYLEIKAAVEFDKETTDEKYPGKKGISLSLAQYAMLFQNIGIFKRLAIGCILQFFQQFTGINAIIYYAPTVGL